MSAGPAGPATFGSLLRAFRQARSLTQEELAQRARLSAKAVGALERGERRRPYPHTVRALADALDLDEDERARLVAAVTPPSEPDVPDLDGDPRRPTPAADPGQPPSEPLVPVGTPLVGRTADLDRLVDLVTARRHRLVTLVGPGGVGKTRLALAVVAHLADHSPDTTAVVDLAPLRDPGLVLARVAATLGLPDRPGTPALDLLVPFLAGRPTVLLMDNLEQVIGCAPDVATLVATCPDLSVLATSRAPLRVRAEFAFPVEPLAVPGRDAPDDLTSIATVPAVELFLERCAAAGVTVGSGGGDGHDDGTAVAELCRRLEGLPLALELAAAATRLLSPGALLARLDDDPSGGIRDLPARQRSMASVLDWSIDLLEPDARVVFPRLAVFGGGFDLESVEAVARPAGDVTAVVGQLVDHALVGRVRTGPAARTRDVRWRLLEPVRRDGMRRLHVAGEAVATADRHADHFHARANATFDHLRGPDSAACLDTLEADHADLRAAFLRLVETDRDGAAADLLHGVWLGLAIRGRSGEGLAWAERLAGRVLDDVGLCTSGLAEAGLRYAVGDLDATWRLAETALARAGTCGRDDLEVEACLLAGAAAIFLGDVPAGRRLLARARDLPRTRTDPWAATHATIVEVQAALLSGDAEADRLTREAIRQARAVGDGFTLATTLNLRANLTDARDDHEGSAALLAEAVHLSLAARMSWTLVYALPALAAVAVRVDDPEAAAVLFGACASVMAVATVEASFPATRDLSGRALADARDRLGPTEFRAAWDIGRVATPDDLVAIADRLTRAPGRPSAGSDARRGSPGTAAGGPAAARA